MKKRRARTGRGILRIKRGFNPNSSSLGFDVTFLLGSLGAVSLFTTVISTLLRLRKPTPHGDGAPAEGDAP